MILEACTCDEGGGVAHSHEGKMALVERDGDRWCEWQPTGAIRIWVDWREVVRQWSREEWESARGSRRVDR